MSENKKRKVVLLILDGWGISETKEHNAIYLGKTANYDKLITDGASFRKLSASGLDVGLPEGQMGNSEVGHMNIGAGRIIEQELVKISNSLETGQIKEKDSYKLLVETAKKNGGCLHLFALISDGGVHSHIDQIKGLAKIAHEDGVQKVLVHAITDGRDTPPSSAQGFVEDLNNYLESNNIGKVATIVGRFFAMDRDNRWDRVKVAYEMLREGKGKVFNSIGEAFSENLQKGVTAEFFEPSIIDSSSIVKDNETILFANFRADRVREICKAFAYTDFDEFPRKNNGVEIKLFTLTVYDETFNFPVLFDADEYKNILADVLLEEGLASLRIAETEKYPHVTYFFNGGDEKEYKGEKRVLINSPKDVRTYDLKPEMSIYEVTDRFCTEFETGDIDVVVMNFANPDMVGHTGIEAAAIDAIEAVDQCLGKVVESCHKMDAELLITADHGNCEIMFNDDVNEAHTQHTTNLVPFILVSKDLALKDENNKGKLADISPTILDIFGIEKPAEMTGDSLLKK